MRGRDRNVELKQKPANVSRNWLEGCGCATKAGVEAARLKHIFLPQLWPCIYQELLCSRRSVGGGVGSERASLVTLSP